MAEISNLLFSSARCRCSRPRSTVRGCMYARARATRARGDGPHAAERLADREDRTAGRNSRPWCGSAVKKPMAIAPSCAGHGRAQRARTTSQRDRGAARRGADARRRSNNASRMRICVPGSSASSATRSSTTTPHCTPSSRRWRNGCGRGSAAPRVRTATGGAATHTGRHERRGRRGCGRVTTGARRRARGQGTGCEEAEQRTAELSQMHAEARTLHTRIAPLESLLKQRDSALSERTKWIDQLTTQISR